LGGEGDPITISDESGGGSHSTSDHTTDERAEAPRFEGRMPWPIGLHSIEEEKKRKNEEEEQRRRREEEKQHR